MICYPLFLCELSFAVQFKRPCHQGKGVVTSEKNSANLVHPHDSSGAGSPKVPSLMFSFNLLLLNICVSNEDQLDPTST